MHGSVCEDNYVTVLYAVGSDMMKPDVSVYIVVATVASAAVLAVLVVVVIRLNYTRSFTLCEYKLESFGERKPPARQAI